MNDLFDGLPFRPADILLPQNCDLSLWSVIACDQYTAQPEYMAQRNIISSTRQNMEALLSGR